MQLDLPMKGEMIAVDPVSIDRRQTFTQALVLCAEIGDLTPQKLAGKVVKDEESWSRIKSPTPKQFFPQDKLNDLMDMAQNEVPLIWLARRRGYELHPMETELERRLRLEREKRAEVEKENAILRRLLGRP